MSAASQREASQRMAQYMRDHNITRTTGACPNHCGAHPTIGGPGLMSHRKTR